MKNWIIKEKKNNLIVSTILFFSFWCSVLNYPSESKHPRTSSWCKNSLWFSRDKLLWYIKTISCLLQNRACILGNISLYQVTFWQQNINWAILVLWKSFYSSIIWFFQLWSLSSSFEIVLFSSSWHVFHQICKWFPLDPFCIW